MEKTIIDADKWSLDLGIKEILKYKDLFYTLAHRDFKVRYVQTYLGLIWSIIKPSLTIMVFTLVFSKGLNLDTGDIPYPLFAVSGLAAWSYFSTVMSQAGNSIIASQNMVQKIYFPRLIIPISKAVVGLLDFGITFLLFLLIMVYFDYQITTNIIYLPLFIVVLILSALGVGIWLSALTIRYRDFQQIVPFLVQFGLFITPVAYSAEVIIKKLPAWASIIYYLNPMTGVIDGIRWCLLDTPLPSNLVFLSFGIVFILFFTSLFYFKRVEKVIADII